MKYTFLVFFICFLLINKSLEIQLDVERPNKIEKNMFQSQFNPFTLKLNISDKFQNLQVLLDTYTEKLYLFSSEILDGGYNANISETVETNEEDVHFLIKDNWAVKGYTAKDIVHDLKTEEKFSFVLVNNINFDFKKYAFYDGFLGLGRMTCEFEEDKAFDLPQFLLDKKIIPDKNVMSIVHDKDDYLNKAKIYIGEYDGRVFSEVDNYLSYCSSDIDKKNWNCKTNELKIYNLNDIQLSYEYDDDTYVYFSIADEYIYFPKIMYDEIMDVYLKDIKEEYNCSEIIASDLKVHYYKCDNFKNENVKLSNISLVLENKLTINFNNFDLWKEDGDYLIFKIMLDENNYDIILGEPAFKEYNFIFDYEMKAVSFINVNDIRKKKKPAKKIPYLIPIIIGVIVLAIIVCWCIYRKNRTTAATEYINQQIIEAPNLEMVPESNYAKIG